MDLHAEIVHNLFGPGRQMHQESPLGPAVIETGTGYWQGVILLGNGSGSPAVWASSETYSTADEAAAAARERLTERLKTLFA
jgi:hypothetical protein